MPLAYVSIALRLAPIQLPFNMQRAASIQVWTAFTIPKLSKNYNFGLFPLQ